MNEQENEKLAREAEFRKFGVVVTFNPCSRKLWNRLPLVLQGTAAGLQLRIERAVLRVFPQALAQSGFRCVCENGRWSGLAHSDHLVFLARDYSGISCSGPLPVIPGLKVVRESEKGIHHFALVEI